MAQSLRIEIVPYSACAVETVPNNIRSHVDSLLWTKVRRAYNEGCARGHISALIGGAILCYFCVLPEQTRSSINR